jgi:transposase-like protein
MVRAHAVLRFSVEIRKVIYATNAVESLNMTSRKVIKNARLVSERRIRY